MTRFAYMVQYFLFIVCLISILFMIFTISFVVVVATSIENLTSQQNNTVKFRNVIY